MNRRAILFVVFLFAISGFLTACGGNSSDSDPTSTTEQETQEEQANETPATTENPDETADEGTSITTPDEAEEEVADEPDSDSTDVASNVVNPNRIVYSPTSELIDSLDPAFVYDSGSGMVVFNIYDFLVFYDGPHPDQFIPMISTAVPSVDNGLSRDNQTTYAFPIRTGIKFHYGPVTDANGDVIAGSGELTPEDVVYSFQRALLQDRTGGPIWMLWEPLLGTSSLLEYARSIEAEAGLDSASMPFDELSEATLMQVCQDVKSVISQDAETVLFKLKDPFAPFIQIVAGYWGAVLDREFMIAEIDDPEANLEKAADWDGTCETWTNFYDPLIEDSSLFDVANGTGPYKLERWRHAEETLLVRNEAYWRERPAHIEQVVIKPTSEWPTRLLTLQEGDSDLLTVRTANRDQIDPLVDQGLVTRYENLDTNVIYFWKINQLLNMENNPYVGSGEFDGQGIPADFFKDADVRKGFAYVIDYLTFETDINGNDGIRATSPILSSVLGYNAEQAHYPYDLAKAEEHFKAAYDGELWETGFKFTIPFVPGASVVPNLSRLMSLELSEINPKFQLVVQDFQGTQISRDDELGKVPFDFSSWSEDYHDAHNWAFPVFHSRGYYATTMSVEPELQARLDDLINEARVEGDTERREQLYYEIQKINYDEALMLPLVEYQRKVYTRSWLKNFVYNSAYPNVYYFWHYTKEDATN